jgi:hypothetical protein
LMRILTSWDCSVNCCRIAAGQQQWVVLPPSGVLHGSSARTFIVPCHPPLTHAWVAYVHQSPFMPWHQRHTCSGCFVLIDPMNLDDI